MPSTNDDVIEKILSAALFAVVAKNNATDEVVGTALMQALNNWLEKIAANKRKE